MKFLKLNTDLNFEVVEDSKKDALELAQSCVGGLIESVDGYFDLPAGVHGWVNEEGLLMNLDLVMIFTYGGRVGWLVGNVVFTGINEEGWITSLTEDQIEQTKQHIEAMTQMIMSDMRNGESVDRPVLFKKLY